MKILIAIDASKHSDAAVEFLTRMRWPPGSSMVVITVLSPMARAVLPAEVGMGTVVPTLSEPGFGDESGARARETLAHAEAILRSAGFSTEVRLLEGEPREEILLAASRERADLLVLGSHGRVGIARLLLGSVSSHVVTHAPCSVLIVKAPARR